MANRYWVGADEEEWNNDPGTKWAATSGGTGGESVPTSSDDVFFDANSGTGIVYIDDPIAKSIDCTGFTGTMASTSMTFELYGSVTFSSGMTFDTFEINVEFKHLSGTAVLTTNGHTIYSIYFYAPGSTGTIQLGDNLNLISGGRLEYFQGSFDANGKDVIGVGSLTLDGDFTGANALYNLIINGTADFFSNLYLWSNIEITNLFTANGNSSFYRLLIRQINSSSNPVIITANAISFSNVDLLNITGAGAADWDISAITGLSGDCGGNSGITFTAPTTQTWSGTSGGNWSANAWTSRIPLPQDNAVIASAFSGTETITLDYPRIPELDFTGASTSGTLNLTLSTGVRVFGDIILNNAVTPLSYNGGMVLSGEGNFTIVSSGKTIGWNLNIDKRIGSYSLGDNLSMLNSRSLTVSWGQFDTNNFDISVGVLSSEGSRLRALNLGSSLIELTGGTGNPLALSTTSRLTINAGTSTIKLTGTLTANRTFTGAGYTFYNFWNATSGAFAVIISGSNTFNDIKIDAGRIQRFTAGTTQTINSLTVPDSVSNGITIGSATNATHTLSKSSGIVVVTGCTISYSIATGGATWRSVTASGNVDGGNNSGWVFVDTIRAKANINQLMNSTVQSKARVKQTTVSDIEAMSRIFKVQPQTIQSTARLLLTAIQTIQAKAYISFTPTKLIEAKARVKNFIAKTIQAKSYIVSVGKVVLYAPTDGGSQSGAATFMWYIPTNRWAANLNFHLQIDDTDDTFASVVLDKKSWQDSGFEYWNGSSWEAVPITGVSQTYAGNLVRYNATLLAGTKYWRVKAYAG